MKKISRGSKIFFALSIVTFLAGIGVVIYYFTRIKFQNSIKYIELAFSSMEDAEKYLRLTDKVQRIFIDIFVVAFVELLIGFIIIGLRVLIAKMKQNKEAKVQRRNAAPAPMSYDRGVPQPIPQQQSIPVQPPVMKQPIPQPILQSVPQQQSISVQPPVMKQPIPQPTPQSVPQQQSIPVQPTVMQQPVQQPIPHQQNMPVPPPVMQQPVQQSIQQLVPQQRNIPVQPPVMQQPIQQPIPPQQNIPVPPSVPQQQNIPTQSPVMQQPIQQPIQRSTPQHQNVTQDASTQRFCMTCGTKIVSGSKFCPKCGSKTI